ncbi:g5916 [Coccomyxa viridis]|uniref:BRISC and BRCA1-A complex member 2 n=1 Tax=Coccomyxa viridis TaxID=1274662 RepID=A0ABP1G0R5_9CHLO
MNALHPDVHASLKDIVVPDEHFAPLLRSEKVLAACLIAHDVQHRGLTNYVEELLACYEEHQRCLLNQIAMPGTVLRFEVDTVFRAADVKTQTLCMPTQAIFVVTLYRSAELYPLQSLLVPLGIRHADLQDMEQDIKLKIAFPLSVSHLQRAPSRQLHIPRRLEELTGVVGLPSWPAGKMCILEYLPMVKEAFEDSLRRAARAYTLRREFLRALSKTELGPPIELEEASHSTATFDIVSEECPMLLMIDLPAAFPQQKPGLTLQAGQEVPAAGIQDYDWDPAWPAAEMADRVYAALKRAELAPC